MPKESKNQLYLRGYPTLIDQIKRLVDLVQAHDPNICALVLFGSTARLTPHRTSDADMLILCRHPKEFDSLYLGDQRDRGVYLIVEAVGVYDEWSFASLVSDLQISDLSPDLIANIARDGVLLYQREGVALPSTLAHLQPYDTWLKRVDTLLERCRRLAQPASV